MLLVLISGFALSQAFRTAAGIMAPPLQQAFGLSPQQLGLFAAQTTSAVRLQRYEIVVAALIGVMIVAAILYALLALRAGAGHPEVLEQPADRQARPHVTATLRERATARARDSC